MPEAHHLVSSLATTSETAVCDSFFRRYRELLDAEDHAFDELEHAYEDGDRAHFDSDMEQWRSAFERRMTFLERSGMSSPLVL
jgi:hypothetical protein